MDRRTQRIFLCRKIPEILREGGIWNLDEEIDIEEVKYYCDNNDLKYIPLTLYSYEETTPLISFLNLLLHHIDDELLSAPAPKTVIEKHNLITEFSQNPIRSLFSCFEYLIKSHRTQIIIYIHCNKHFPMDDDVMEALHSISGQSKNSIALLFQNNSYRKDFIKHLKFYYMNKPIFISYKHTERGTEYVRLIQAGLNKENLNYSIDVKDLQYRNNIREYEELIGKSSRCIVIITPEYLESPHCMYELTQIQKHGNIESRVFPLVDTGKYTRDSAGLNLLKRFWDDKRNETYKNASSPSPFTTNELNDIDTVINKLDDLWRYLHDIDTGNIDELTENNAEKLISEICQDIEEEMSLTPDKDLNLDTVGLSKINSDAPIQQNVNQYGNNPINIGTLHGNININNSGK